MDNQIKENLATKYSINGSDGSQIDYLRCFRAYLHNAADLYVPSEPSELKLLRDFVAKVKGIKK